MSLRQVAAVTDTGRRRRHNEDAFVCEPPLFAVADGMGGAQAGEVASRLAAAALSGGAEEGGGEKRVEALIQEANRTVFERSSEDSSLSGMGTTMTVALVEGTRVAIGHVGDSRAYLVRDGTLEQITEDHSLVAELARAGKLSEDEAETHPQRSVITRALGTDPDVDVDTLSVEARPGDVFLLCSDGLTSMLDDDEILGLVNKHADDLKGAAKALVKAANRRGGEDNITVVFFELAERPVEEETMEQAMPEDGAEVEADEDTLSELEGVPAITTAERVDEWGRDGDVPAAEPERPEPRLRRRRAAYWLAALLIVAAAAGLGLFGLSQAHFVGAEPNGRVAVYQGVPWDLVGGLRLYRKVYVSPLRAADLTQDERRKLFDHDLRGYGSARAAVRRYEQQIVP